MLALEKTSSVLKQRRRRHSVGLSGCLGQSAGLLVPDIPLEETGPIREVATAAGLELVLLTTPTTPQPRMEAIAKASQGFVYLVSVTGGLFSVPLVLLQTTMRAVEVCVARKADANDSWLAAGVTGQRVSMESRVEGLIEQLHQITDKSVAVGFGVSGPEQVCVQICRIMMSDQQWP